MLAAFIPARNAARVEPVQALQKGRYQVLGAGENRVRRMAAFIAIAASLVCLAFSSYRPAFYLGFAFTVGAADPARAELPSEAGMHNRRRRFHRQQPGRPPYRTRR